MQLLFEWAQVEGDASRQDVAQRLGQWVSAVDAVKLESALQTIESYPTQTKLKGQWVDVSVGQARMAQIKQELKAHIDLKTTPVLLTLPRPKGDARPPEDPDAQAEAKYAPHYQRYLAVQKHMEQVLGALRAEIRQLLAKGLTPLRQLVALDAVMEQQLGSKEQRLWATVPVFLERRMNHRSQMHQQAVQASGGPDDPNTWRLPEGWISLFQADMKEILLAELHVRMQAVAGLLEAAHAIQQAKVQE